MKYTTLMLALLLASCGPDRTAGTGSQTGNSIVAGRIVRADSTPASYIAVTLSPASWIPDSGDAMKRSMVSDSVGSFRFDVVHPGLWRLESYGSGTAMVRTLRTQADRDSTLPPIVVRQTGNLVVEIHLDDTLRSGMLVVLGTSIARSLDTRNFEIYVPLQGLAPGFQCLVIRGKDGRLLREARAYVRSAGMDTIRYTEWSRTIYGPHPDGEEDDDDDDDEEDGPD